MHQRFLATRGRLTAALVAIAPSTGTLVIGGAAAPAIVLARASIITANIGGQRTSASPGRQQCTILANIMVTIERAAVSPLPKLQLAATRAVTMEVFPMYRRKYQLVAFRTTRCRISKLGRWPCCAFAALGWTPSMRWWGSCHRSLLSL